MEAPLGPVQPVVPEVVCEEGGVAPTHDDADSWEHAMVDEQPDHDCVLVDKQDAVEALAYYLATVLLKHPEAQNLPPKKLQEALTTALQGLKQSRFKQMVSYAKSTYRWTALCYSAMQMWQNPWVVQCILTAFWTFSRMSVRAGRGHSVG
ncbi:uncharacterized protein HaLaN_19114, partial [Haematococcus lacustris]